MVVARASRAVMLEGRVCRLSADRVRRTTDANVIVGSHGHIFSHLLCVEANNQFQPTLQPVALLDSITGFLAGSSPSLLCESFKREGNERRLRQSSPVHRRGGPKKRTGAVGS
jgi:hypothetical protein